MQRESDEDRIRRKAHELWEAEGHPHGRDQDHWDQAREIIAIEDSQTSTLLPRDTGVDEPIENADESLRNLADFPNLTDQGENLLTSTDREPSYEPGTTGSAEMPSVEVPTSDQPGITEPSRHPAAAQPATPKSSSRPASPVFAGPTGAAQPKTASFPKVAAPETVKLDTRPKTVPKPAPKKR